ncbi:ATP-binding protein [Geomonas sp. Red32]|uniref:hybrid sensor histidine kinase/response regulator n=1 Tax=Geomonas sp. Red32 TaxID=2912856 RepID=UPI00202CC41B|nr:PAS domain-containing sensor histidine kinase [Geomonas sp. Red32]MCM0082917.1 ATP-binding protein [Geomonas sp. Red32]
MDRLFQNLWDFVVKGQEIPLEVRLFRLVTLTAANLCLFVILPINIILDLPVELNEIIAVYSVITFGLYELSLRGRHFITSYYWLTLAVLNGCWMFNAGDAGSIAFYFFAAALYPLTFFKGGRRHALLLLMVADYCALVLLQYNYPQLVVPFQTPQDRIIDLTSGFGFSLLAFSLIFWVIITSLTRELEDRKRAEDSLAENERTLKSLLDFMPAGVWWHGEDGRIEYVNHSFRKMFGYGPEDHPRLKDWYPVGYLGGAGDGAGASNGNHDGRGENGSHRRARTRELKITCRDGSCKHVLVNTQRVLGRTIELFTDITEREMLQDQLLKVQKLESLGVLAGGIAHDFNNILTSIMGNVSFARALVEPGTKVQECLEQSEKASMRAAELAKQLLTFAKKGEPMKQPLRVGDIIDESLSLALRGSHVQAELQFPPSLPTIEADPGQLSQAFNNIILNALHSMPVSGILTIQGDLLSLEEGNGYNLPGGDYVKLRFIDQGEGISPADLNKIFDPYFTTKPGGSGLGLASTHSIVSRHGGAILVASTPGSGTTFTVVLPASGEPLLEGPALPPEPLAERTGTGKVLVMDDEEMICRFAADLLGRFGYAVETCFNGEQAIAMYRQALEKGEGYSAVILDLTIPGGMGGKEAAARLLELDANARLIVSTGYSNDLALAEWKNFGFAGCLKKPYLASDILRIVERVTGG